MATENKKYIPALRFPEFQNDGEWSMLELGKFAKIVMGQSPSSEAYNERGEGVPLLQGNADIKDRHQVVRVYTTDITKTCDINDIIMTVRAPVGTISRASFKSCIGRGVCAIKTDSEYLYQYLISIEQEWDKLASGSTFVSITSNQIFDRIIFVPLTIQEQKKIANCLSSLDKYIDATKRKLELLKEHKKGLMQRLFPAKGKTTPELRFPEFQNDGEWQIVSLGEITSVVNRRNKSNRSLPIYSINNAEGFVPQSQQFTGMDSEARGYDISAYKIIGKHTFAYNPARINVGSIGYSGELKDILISSLYVCFKTMDNVDDDFIMCFFNSYIFNQAVESNVEGGIRSYLFYENFSRINIAIPSLYEQKKIASCITSIEDVIKQTNEQISLLETHKKGLLQQLFPMIK